LYIKKQQLPENDADLRGFGKIVANKFHVDEFYHKVFVNPIMIISDLLLVLVDKLIIDMVVNLTAIIVDALGRLYRLIQTGSTGFYLIAMVLSMVIVMFIQIIL
jgi:NADH-quinone oxidoreductase subunit L